MGRSSMSALEYIFSLRENRMLPGVERLERVLERLGNPQDQVPAVHVAGTNGKGSTCAMVESVLRRAGNRTGLFTSPHLICFTERIRIDGVPIDRDALESLTEVVRDAAGGVVLSYFEFATALAFLHFARSGVQVAVLEVGLGGRLDATILCRSAVSVIVSIGLDHCDFLGHTEELIAAEKAAIMRQGVPVVCGAVGPAGRVVRQHARAVGAPLTLAGEGLGEHLRLTNGCGSRVQRPCRGGALLRPAAPGDAADELLQIRLQGQMETHHFHNQEVRLGLRGEHQRHNAACALAALVLLQESRTVPAIPEEALREGMRACSWPGRAQLFEGAPGVLVDGAHNPQGAEALARLVHLQSPRPSRVVWLAAMMMRKDHRAIIREILPVVDEVVVVGDLDEAYFREAREVRETILEEAESVWVGGGEVEAKGEAGSHPLVQVATGPEDGLARARRAAGPGGLVLVAGSLMLAGLVLPLLD